MKKVKTATKDGVSIGSKVVTGQQIALSLLIVSSFVLGLNFMAMSFSVGRKITGPTIISEPVPIIGPLLVSSISDASVNIPIYSNGIANPFVEFLANGVTLGNLNLAGGYDPMGIQNSTANIPLALQVYGEAGMVVPARVINIESQGVTHTLCLPDTATNINDVPTYYYDTNGTPYYDSLLSRQATSLPCNQLLAKRLDIGNIDAATVNVLAQSQSANGPYAEFLGNFAYNSNPLGSLDLSSNYYSDSDVIFDYEVGAPLAIQVLGDAGTVVPDRIINIQSQGATHTLCLPSVGFSVSGDYPIIYYYDTNGTPYYDSLLSRQATSLPCNQLLANAFDINDITRASVNSLVEASFPGDTGIIINFRSNFSTGTGDKLGQLNLINNFYADFSNYGYQVGAPLSILMWNSNSEDITITVPPRVINVETNNVTHHLCLPESYFPGGTGPYENPIYFYDIYGTPYYDSFLTNRATSLPCNQIVLAAPEITSPLTVNATVGNYFSYNITATNNPTSFRASNLPSGLAINTTTGVISGTPTVAGAYNIVIYAVNQVGMDSENVALIIGTIKTNVNINSL